MIEQVIELSLFTGTDCRCGYASYLPMTTELFITLFDFVFILLLLALFYAVGFKWMSGMMLLESLYSEENSSLILCAFFSFCWPVDHEFGSVLVVSLWYLFFTLATSSPWLNTLYTTFYEHAIQSLNRSDQKTIILAIFVQYDRKQYFLFLVIWTCRRKIKMVSLLIKCLIFFVSGKSNLLIRIIIRNLEGFHLN